MSHAASSTEVDSVYMRRALALAQGGWGQTAPNPMVGAVVVAGSQGNEKVVGEGFHAHFGGAHAEVVALRQAGALARGATLYVTLEPCAHFGKTPPCVDAIIASGIARVVAAVRDPSVEARGGLARLRDAGVVVDTGVERDLALELNAPFFFSHADHRPWITLKLALSADGGIADTTGEQRWITGPSSRAEVHRLRANVDAIAVGVGTVLCDDPSLTVRDAKTPRVAPRRIVFDSRLRTPRTSAMVKTARDIPTILVSQLGKAPVDREAMLMDTGVRILQMPSLHESLHALKQDGIRSLFVEGGARLAGSFLTESLVDRLIIFRAPLVLGDAALQAFAFAPPDFETSLRTARVAHEQRFGDDVMTVYALHEVPCLLA